MWDLYGIYIVGREKRKKTFNGQKSDRLSSNGNKKLGKNGLMPTGRSHRRGEKNHIGGVGGGVHAATPRRRSPFPARGTGTPFGLIALSCYLSFRENTRIL